jgi:hypothetical protein
MEKKRTYPRLLALLMMGFLFACTKSEVRTHKILKHGDWQVTELLIGTQSMATIPKWHLDEPSEDGAFSTGTWTHYNGTKAQFKWRFDPYVGTFSFSIDKSITQDKQLKAYIQCNNLAGEYTVLKDKSKMFEFESLVTNGYPETSVFIRIEPL